jgi:DNA sulfur modification protein DndB
MPYSRSIAALPVDDTQFTTTLTTEELLEVVIPGRAFLPRAKNDPVTARQVRDLGAYHDKIQRDLTGPKLKNAKGSLKDYIVNEWAAPRGTGVLPAFVVWFRDPLVLIERADCPVWDAAIPSGTKGLLLDAESRVEAFLYGIEDETLSSEDVRNILGKRVAVVMFHGVAPELAAKYFADINGKGVGVNPNLLIARDLADPFGQVTLEVFDKLGVELELQKRQVAAKSSAVITALQARTMIAAMVHGVGVVASGGQRVPDEGVDFDRLRDAAIKWIDHIVQRFTVEGIKDKSLTIGSVPVLVSLGALGRGFYENDHAAQTLANSVLNDTSIDWSKGPKWNGVCGKVNAAGRFSVGGAKENAYATHRALIDASDPGYRAIRS